MEMSKGRTSTLTLGAYKVTSTDLEKDKDFELEEEKIESIFGFDVAGVMVFADEDFENARERMILMVFYC